MPCEWAMTGAPHDGLMQIGQVAERTGLSLRTIRWYGQEGLVVPTSRTDGGFRLYRGPPGRMVSRSVRS
jgi:MerR family transcriptional regulator, copper efflux regulator